MKKKRVSQKVDENWSFERHPLFIDKMNQKQMLFDTFMHIERV